MQIKCFSFQETNSSDFIFMFLYESVLYGERGDCMNVNFLVYCIVYCLYSYSIKDNVASPEHKDIQPILYLISNLRYVIYLSYTYRTSLDLNPNWHVTLPVKI